MHSNEMEEIDRSSSGDIVALFGIECSSGDTFCSGKLSYSMTSMHVPEPVISLAITPKDNKSQVNMSKALNRFTKEDPTFKTFVDAESGETIIRGMGELHLEVYVERMKREYEATVDVGQPQVAYRESITQEVKFDYTHKKQTGGSGQYGRVGGIMKPLEEGDYEFVDSIVGGSIPREYISSCDKGFQSCLKKGTLVGAPITGVSCEINDGASHSVDSSDMAYQQAAIGAFKQAYSKASPHILEPIMKVVVETPSEYQGSVLATINQRRGMIVGTNEDGAYSVIESEVPLSEMFGYSTILRSSTQGKAEFTMEFARYRPVPKSVSEELIKKYQDELKKKSAA
jgi:elongation factor G